MDVEAHVQPRSSEIEAVIIRADGTRIPLGLIAGRHRNPFINLWFKVRRIAAARRIRKANQGRGK